MPMAFAQFHWHLSSSNCKCLGLIKEHMRNYRRFKNLSIRNGQDFCEQGSNNAQKTFVFPDQKSW